MTYPTFTLAAQKDLIDLAEFIASDNSEAAFRVVNAIEETAVRIAENPEIGTVADSKRHRDLRFLPCGEFPIYKIYYRALADGVTVIRVLHGARNQFELI